MDPVELKILIETLFIRHDKLWHFKVSEVNEFCEMATQIAQDLDDFKAEGMSFVEEK